MQKRISDFLNKYSIKNENVVVGFSAGPDSVCLASVLAAIKNDFNLNIALCYFNHGWREEAVKEEEFTAKFAKKYNFEHFIGKAPDNIKKNEEEARMYRYNFLNSCAENYNSTKVLLGHNKNDNIETLLYRIIRGTSISGLTSIPEKRDIYYRPMLNILKEEILEYLNKNNLDYLIDSSNNDEKYARNLIRKSILPLFYKINPNYVSNLQSLIDNSLDSRKIIDNAVLNTLSDIKQDNKILYNKFILLPNEMRYEIIRTLLFDKLKNRDKKSISKIDNFILNNEDSRISINKQVFLRIKNNYIFLQQAEIPTNIKDKIIIKQEGIYEFQGYKINISKSNHPDKYPKSNENTCFLNINFPFQFRFRQDGDIFSPYGIKGTMKLKKYFINEKIPLEVRDKILLLANKNEICWVVSNRISEKYKVQSDKCLKFEIKRMD